MAGTQGSSTTKDETVLAQAEEWFVRLRAGDMTIEDVTAWQRWLEHSELHRRAFRDVEKVWEKLGRVQDLSWPTTEELNADRYEGQMPLAEWIGARAVHPTPGRPELRLFRAAPPANVQSRRPRAGLWSGAVAACVVVMVAGLLLNREFFDPSASPGPVSVATDVGEHQELTLPDGSVVTVGARSKLSAQFSERIRSVLLQSGEAYFAVAPEEARPFVVRAGEGTITAVGTAFNVQEIAGRVAVTVVEGSVQVARFHAPLIAIESPAASTPPRGPSFPPTRVRAGEQLVYGEVFAPVRTVDSALAVTWRAGHLKYLDQPLKFVIPDIQRYSRKRLVIADERVGELEFTGTVFEDNVEEWVEALETSHPVQIVAVGAGTLLLEARGR